MRLALFGSGAFGLPTFERLSGAHEIAQVITQPDRPAGRGRKLTPTPVGAWAESTGLSVLRTPDVSGTDLDRVRAIRVDAWVIIAFGQKLSPALLADRFAVNLHASLLPRWRGAAPINHAVLAGDAETGNSVITLADRMDAGLILGRTRRAIGPAETAGDLHERLAEDGPDVVEHVLAAHRAGTLEPETQNEALVTHAGKLEKARDGWVDFYGTAEECRRRINGLNPWPSVTVHHRGEPIKLLRAQVEPSESESNVAPGTVTDATRGLIACGSGVLRVLEAQASGKPAEAWETFAPRRGVRPGDVLEGRKTC